MDPAPEGGAAAATAPGALALVQRPPARLETIALPLPQSLKSRLLEAGFRTLSDYAGVSPEVLTSAARLTQEELHAVWATAVAPANAPPGRLAAAATSALDLLRAETAPRRRVITFCSDLDRLLGGGVALGRVTEFCGVPGVGKTQLGMQLCVDVQLPAAFGGVEGQAVYIDTEGSFMIERVADIAGAAVRHVAALAGRSGAPEQATAAATFTLESVLEGISYFRVQDSAEQLALAALLEALLEARPQVKLLVLDSVTFHFRQDWPDMAQRTRVLARLAADLQALAERHDVAVVTMNQVATKVSEGDGPARLVPALGESWGQAASVRAILFWDGSQRAARLYKSPELPARTAPYQVTQDGIRGVPRGNKRQAQHEAAPQPPPGRQRQL